MIHFELTQSPNMCKRIWQLANDFDVKGSTKQAWGERKKT